MLSRSFKLLLLGLVVSLFYSSVWGSASSFAETTNDMLNRLKRLELEINDLNRFIHSPKNKATASVKQKFIQKDILTRPRRKSEREVSGATRVEVRQQQLETEIRTLRGETEELEFGLSNLTKRLDKLISDLDGRLELLEVTAKEMVKHKAELGNSNIRKSAVVPISRAVPKREDEGRPILGYLKKEDFKKFSRGEGSTAAISKASKGSIPVTKTSNSSRSQTSVSNLSESPERILPKGSSGQRYQFAFAFLMKHDYEMAERAFSEFVKDHVDDPLAGNASYWLGETFYVRQKFAKAAITFAEGYEKYPNSTKTADNLLKLGFSLARLDRMEDACVALAQLKTEFPNASTTIKRRAMVEGKRVGCGE